MANHLSSSGRVLRKSLNCCYAGVQHEGNPAYPDVEYSPKPRRTGYLSWAREPYIQEGKGLLLVPDANGLWHNSRLLADQFAAAGYMTLVCPYNGVVRLEDKAANEATPDNTSKLNHAEQQHAHRSAVEAGIHYLRAKGCNTFGILALSEGAKAVTDIIKEKHIAACFLATPKLDDWTVLGETKIPVSIALADEYDVYFGNEPSQHMEIEKELMRSSYPYQISVYSHVHMGFVQRRRMQSKAEVFAKKQAFIQAITFLQEHMLDGI